MGRLVKVLERMVTARFVFWAAILVSLLAGLMLSAAPTANRPKPMAATVSPAPITRHVEAASTTVPLDCAKVACLALTFDDGPNPIVTPQVLDILARHHVQATFFLIGLHVPGNEALVRRMHAEGHEIGNHSWSHRDLTTLSPQEVELEISTTQQAIAAAGVPLPTLFRAPYGAVNAMVRSHVPLTILAWNVDPEDWNKKKAQKIIDEVLATARPGAIIDMHDIRQPTADALDPILTSLEQNYHLVTVSQLFNLPAGQQGIFYGR